MSNLVRFEKVDNELNILRIGGKSFLPPDVEWPTNPNGCLLYTSDAADE